MDTGGQYSLSLSPISSQFSHVEGKGGGGGGKGTV
jgi:hypothetical protein